MQLKLGTTEDFITVSDMAKKFYERTPYFGVVEYDDAKMADVILSLFGTPKERIALIAYDDDGNPVGMIAAQVGELLTSRDRIATELAWWMDPNHRGSRTAIELINAYEYWAKHVAQCRYSQLSCLEDFSVERVSKFYKRKGYKAFERFFIKALH